MINKPTEPEHIGALIRMIKPGLGNLDLKADRATLISAAVEASVRWSMHQLVTLPAAARAMREGRVTHVGGVYELATGRVRFI